MSVLDLFDLSGRVALVTGGAGMYGRHITRALAGAGAVTYVASRDTETLEAFAAEMRGEGMDVRALSLDQGDEASVKQASAALRADAGRLDVLVNNAVARPAVLGMAEETPEWDASFHINGTGLISVTREMATLMGEGGSIINIGSIMGLVGPEPGNYDGTEMQGWYPDYYFHKGGMVSLTRFFASYYGAQGIRCNCLHPGGLLHESHPERFIRNYASRTCLGRLAGDEDLMGAVIFLASRASGYVTGANIPVDGGYTAK